MYCLLCHEKIPRLRAWRTKSEFCSDEHAAQYKKQTLDRLLTDQKPARKERPDPIALTDERDDDLLHDEMSVVAPEPDAATLEELAQARNEAKGAREPEDDDLFTTTASLDAHNDPGDGVEELWRLAEEIDHSEADISLFDERSEDSDVSRQSAEDALRALRMLAEKAAEAHSQQDSERLPESDSDNFLHEHAGSEDSSPVSDEIEDLPPISDELIAELGGALPDFDDPASVAELQSEAAPSDSPGETRPPLASAEEGAHQTDDDTPSILERLMEDPSTHWPQKEAAATLPVADDLEDDPLADFEDLPEPEFSFEDEPVEAVAESAAEPAEPATEEPGADEFAIDADPLADLVALADELGEVEPDLDPLAELIKAEQAARAGEAEEDDDSGFDEAAAEELVKELAEEALRDDLDLQELERNLKVVPFPSPTKSAGTNGHHKHADQIADDVDEAIESNPLRSSEPQEKAASAKAPAKPERPSRPGRARTKFKPSMVMAGVEPAIQGYLQGDPLEGWRHTAVESAWGERGRPAVHSFEAPAPVQDAPGGLQALRPGRDFRGRMNLPITVCTPAEAEAIKPPLNALEPTRRETAPLSSQPLSLDASATIRLGPQYLVFDDVAAVTLSVEAIVDEQPSEALHELAAQFPEALAPAPVFYDSVSLDARFDDEEDWDGATEDPDSVEDMDLSADFADEQPAAQSSGGRRQY